MGRRDDLAEAACDYVLEFGLIGLSLRPLAAAIGTSDRMLLYHFGSRDALVAEILERSTARSLAILGRLPDAPDVAAGVRALWAAHTHGQLDRCQRVYTQAVAQDMLGAQTAIRTVAKANAAWVTGLARYLRRCGAEPDRADRCAEFVDAAIAGLHLDQHLEPDQDVTQVVDDVAVAALTLSSGGLG
jgi:AcrR family transcriptional regulator